MKSVDELLAETCDLRRRLDDAEAAVQNWRDSSIRLQDENFCMKMELTGPPRNRLRQHIADRKHARTMEDALRRCRAIIDQALADHAST